ncbi:unnamed protein product [Adineta ricciae]|uniref:Uncharacterized protein n=1 Tax=Adineta ricciae TaxID=249248 RepID=A0A815UCQ3_ADIRI|nr:unnamed protein product [Adineta ricciae]CAF1515857.1 unnamed protein product [Adineta ricciae]
MECRGKVLIIKLRELSVTSDQLFQWSTSIDLIERYEMYFRNESTANQTIFLNRFYDCTWPLFGSSCQFGFDIRHNSFLELIQNALILPIDDDDYDFDEYDVVIRSVTCYTLLKCQYIHPPPMCLTWRDICDMGKSVV